MGRAALIHDAAWAAAVGVVREFGPPGDHDRAALVREVYAAVRPHLTELLDRYEREAVRLGRGRPAGTAPDPEDWT